jgi:hypothetical protein
MFRGKETTCGELTIIGHEPELYRTIPQSFSNQKNLIFNCILYSDFF